MLNIYYTLHCVILTQLLKVLIRGFLAISKICPRVCNKIRFQSWNWKAVWIYLHTFILGIILKPLGQRCQCHVCLNTESPRHNNPNKFPCGRKQITQGELSMRDHLFTHTQSYRWVFVWANNSSPPPLLSFAGFVSGEETRLAFKDQKNTTCTLKLQFTWDLFSKGGLLCGGRKGSELCGANMVSCNSPSYPPPSLCHP